MIETPHVDWFALSPTLALLGAAGVSLMIAVLLPAWMRRGAAATVAFAGFVTAAVLAAFVFDGWAAVALGLLSPLDAAPGVTAGTMSGFTGSGRLGTTDGPVTGTIARGAGSREVPPVCAHAPPAPAA